MNSLQALAQAAGVAYAAGLNLYATVAVVGIGARQGWIGPLPGALAAATSWWVVGTALVLTMVEFLASLIPAVASAWDTAHSLVRPPAAAVLAAATVWHTDPTFVLIAALIGGGLGATTHATKLGIRYAVDASPEPLSNGVMSLSELGVVTTLMITIWHHPYLALALALTILLILMVLVRMIWRSMKLLVTGRWRRRGDVQA